MHSSTGHTVNEAYAHWARQYDEQANKTRDAEHLLIQEMLGHLPNGPVLELGCGTGKNSGFLHSLSTEMTSVDFSAEMLALAKAKHAGKNITFLQMNLLEAAYPLPQNHFGIAAFSLVLEHIENLEPVFANAAACLQPGGYLYAGELHPFKQLTGSMAQFLTAEGAQIKVPCHLHMVSHYLDAGYKAGLQLIEIKEWCDDDAAPMPRLLGLLWRK